jgi:hypothetical protein
VDVDVDEDEDEGEVGRGDGEERGDVVVGKVVATQCKSMGCGAVQSYPRLNGSKLMNLGGWLRSTIGPCAFPTAGWIYKSISGPLMTPSSRRTETGAGTRSRPAPKRVGRNSEVVVVLSEQQRWWVVCQLQLQTMMRMIGLLSARARQAGPQPKAGRTDTGKATDEIGVLDSC